MLYFFKKSEFYLQKIPAWSLISPLSITASSLCSPYQSNCPKERPGPAVCRLPSPFSPGPTQAGRSMFPLLHGNSRSVFCFTAQQHLTQLMVLPQILSYLLITGCSFTRFSPSRTLSISSSEKASLFSICTYFLGDLMDLNVIILAMAIFSPKKLQVCILTYCTDIFSMWYLIITWNWTGPKLQLVPPAVFPNSSL